MHNQMGDSLALSMKIVRRNWWVYRKDFFSNISPTITDPIMFLVFLGFGIGSMVTEINGHKYTEFLAPGLTVSTALFTAFFESSYGFYVRMTFENVFKAVLTTPIGIREIVMAEFIWVSIKGAVMVLGVAIVLALFGLAANPMLLPLLMIVGVLVALPCGAMGLLASCGVKNINQFQIVYSMIISPLFFMSGVFYPVEAMPKAVRIIAEVLPLSHGVQMARAVFWNQDILRNFTIHGSVLILYAAVLCPWALYQVRRKLQN
jgi:lipooligosaccharide transport system permease protein